ncbi:MAG TPA: filamentous hemagglutinin family protein [Rhizomicrobium sp.]|nr:filamentous hemagglutinin family protein [Rhizomicrobium sp.]
MSGTIRMRERRGNRLRGKLLRGSSVVALVTAIGLAHAHAQSFAQLRAAVAVNNEIVGRLLKNPNTAEEAAERAGMSAAAARAVKYQAQVAQALQLAQQAQDAARQAVLGTTGNVPDGLVIGGLQEVPDPVPAARDPTGTSTWQGADQPTETKSGNNVTVTIKQTQQRAILSWDSFNVGQNTTVNFEQTFKGIAETSWIALNRIVGDSTSPAEILGSIKAQGTVLIIDQNGILFGGASQVNVNALIASTLDVGQAYNNISGSGEEPLSIKDRNDYFLEYGLLGYRDQDTQNQASDYTFSATASCSDGSSTCEEVTYSQPGSISVAAGANIQADSGGYVLLTAPEIVNSGEITAPEGQVSLEAGYLVTLLRSTGASGSATPDIRGYSLSSGEVNQAGLDLSYVENTSDAILSSPQGYVSAMSPANGGVINDGILEATTSVSRNGFVEVDAGNVQLGAGSTIAIGPDPTAETIPQDPVSIEDFKPSKVVIGGDDSLVEVQQNAMIYAPGGDVTVGVASGADTYNDVDEGQGTSRVFIDTGAVIDVAGLPDVEIPASYNSIAIHPVTENTLQDDSTADKDSFLDGATVYVDPRLSGVRSDGVAWVGSPLVPAASYYEQVGINVRQLMTTGGNVTLGADSFVSGGNSEEASDVTVKSGAVIDLDGGWVTYQAGWVKTTELIDSSGNIVNIGDANPDDTYVGIYDGYTVTQSRWGVSQTWSDPLLTQGQYEAAYTEGRDAGTLTLKSSVVVLDGSVYAHAFPGPMQLEDAEVGTGTSGVYGDARNVQAAPSQLPVGGLLFVQAFAEDAEQSGAMDGGGDIDIVTQSNYQPVSGNLEYGQSISIVNGQLVIATRAADSYLPTDRIDTITLSATALSDMGLDDLALATSGEVNVEQGADVTLAAGGDFDVEAGRAITVDGNVFVPSGSINLQTLAVYGSGTGLNSSGSGSVFVPEVAQLGSFDITINGTLSARGLWTNDYGAGPGEVLGDAYTDGGSITLNAAPSVLLNVQENEGYNQDQDVNEDISGSIYINKGALLDVSGGGYVSPLGDVDLSSTGGNVSLIDETNYVQASFNSDQQEGIPGFRVNNNDIDGEQYLPDNPGQINARVVIAPGTIDAYGFDGGGTFSLDTPAISFGNGTPSTGTELPLDFFSAAGFSNYDITTYETKFFANQFTNGYGGYNAVLATDVLTVGAGRTLDLAEPYYALALNDPAREDAQMAALLNLPTGSNIESVIKPNIPADVWDQKAVNLALGGLIELQIDKGGKLLDAPGGVLTVSQLDNNGTIRILGGTIDQTEMLPLIYSTGLAVTSLCEAFSCNANGTIDENAIDYQAEDLGITCGNTICTNDYVAINDTIYLLGTLGKGVGIQLGAGSVTDLAGTSVLDPYAVEPGVPHYVTGTLYAGGTLESQPSYLSTNLLFAETIGFGVYGSYNTADVNGVDNDPQAFTMAEQVVAEPGATLNLSGASAVYDELGADGTYVPTRVWSNGGTLDMGNGGTITGATILAQGGAPEALGGTLEMPDPIFYQNDPSTPTLDAVSEQQIAAAGFSTFIAQGSINSVGDATISLSRAFILESIPYNGEGGSIDTDQSYVPTVNSGGVLTIEAPYIGLDSVEQSSAAPSGLPENNSVIFRADDIDVEGAILFDESVANVTFDATGDVRLIGVQPASLTDGISGTGDIADTLIGQLSVYGNLTIDAAQVYPTTGSTFDVTSLNGTITFGRTTQTTPETPYSAGADLTIDAANIVLGGVIRVPVGTLTIGSDSGLSINGQEVAPGTTSVTALSGSITSVSAAGLSIPYGTTTDQAEWYFSPTGESELTAPPAAVLNFGGASVTLNAGATVDLSGGGDLYAYEFIPGTGGSRDVLDYDNPNEFSGNGGYLYPGGEQVYAIVPGVSSATVAAYDPIYSANYGSLYSASAVGESVYLTGGDGIKAGWYTLLPAQYATLPGGMRIVEDENDASIAPDTSTRLTDGTVLMSGYYGVAGTDARSATPDAFEVQSQSVFEQYSDIALTSADTFFAQLAASNDEITPRLPLDAGRLVLAPTEALVADATFLTAPAEGGRGSEADISGADFDIVSTLDDTPPQSGAIEITAGTLDDLDASSLLIGGVRTDNSDGTTSIDVTAENITVANDSGHPLTAPEVILAASDGITLDDGATIIAKGNPDIPLTGDYAVDGQAALLRVSNGSQRLATLPESAASLTVGDVDLSGNSVLLDSGGDLTIASDADIAAKYLAVGAGEVTFSSNGEGSGLVITPQLQALFSKADELTILSQDTIGFASGTYNFGNVTFDAQGLSLFSGDSVTLNADTLTLDGNGGSACGQSGMPACGNGDLTVNAQQIDFGWGTLGTYGFGQNVTLSAPKGMMMVGQGTVDFGPAALTLETPYLGDMGSTPAPGVNETIPSLSLVTTGSVTIDNPTGASVPDVQAVPGASLSIAGYNISVDNTELRATAGNLTLNSQTGIDISGDAVIETPSYSKTFGDSADPSTVSAPGGTLTLIAQDGDIDADSSTTISVGGDAGTAGTLSLSAANGSFNMNGTIDASAPNGGGSLDLTTGGSFDLATFSTSFAKDFSGTIDITTGAGDLVLPEGDELKAQNVLLDADGGLVDIGGTIDVSGTNGGTVDLYGLTGVTLESTALIDAHANGYTKDDPRQASGGTVNIGTDQNGAIDVKSGAVIDVAALQTEARLVPMTMYGTTYYTYVPGDTGGTVNFRLPVIDGQNGETVNMTYAGDIEGASAIDLIGFERWNLQDVVNSGDFVGVTIADGVATLDVGATGSDPNFLADNAAGTVVNFIQNFNISADYGNLGGLASQANFQARPGVELDYSGTIVLASNWNLGAGTVDIAAAVKAGLMLPVDPGCTSDCQYYIIPGDEGEVFSKYTSLTYRVGGDVLGAAPVLTIRAGGNLDIDGSVTDGFFQFGDQTDSNYLNAQLGGGNEYWQPYIQAACVSDPANCTNLVNWQSDLSYKDLLNEGLDYIGLSLPGSFKDQSFLYNPAPYNPDANSPSAAGDAGLDGTTSDALDSMEVFPAVTNASGTHYAQSTSYQFVAGADLDSFGGDPSADPLRTVAGTDYNIVVGNGPSSFEYGCNTTACENGTTSYIDQLDFQVGNDYLTAGSWYMAFLTQYPSADADSYTFINYAKAPAGALEFIDDSQAFENFLAEYEGDYTTVTSGSTITGIETTLNLANLFMLDVIEPDFAAKNGIISYYTSLPSEHPNTNTATEYYTTLVRTGTGSIDMAASGDINLQDGPVTDEQLNNGDDLQLGGSAVYTVGHLADIAEQTVVDELTGQTFTIDPDGYDETGNVFSQPLSGGYEYGDAGGSTNAGFAGIMIANPVYLTGGGSISLTAGQDILSRRDVYGDTMLADNYDNSDFYSWIGSGDQPWRVGTVGDITNILINPQLFTEGVGALGGGNIAISAGGDIVDLTVADDTSVTTASISSRSIGLPTLGIWQFGGGDVTIDAGDDILGGRFDIGEGSMDVTAGGDIAGDGTIQVFENDIGTYTMPDALRLRLTDATISVSAQGSVDIGGIGALGVYSEEGLNGDEENLNAHGFYSSIAGVSIVSDGSVAIDNQTPYVPISGSQPYDLSIVTNRDGSTDDFTSAVYPGSLYAAALTGSLNIDGSYANSSLLPNSPYGPMLESDEIVLYPSPVGQLNLYAGADIEPVTIDMEDGDPGLLPGIFSVFSYNSNGAGILAGRTFGFPSVEPGTDEATLDTYHNSTPTHIDDPYPVRIDAGGDILDMIVSVPKQARIWAGQDIINMMFFGQNLLPTDITRIVAGRDITATTELVSPVVLVDVNGQEEWEQEGTPEEAVEGNDFIIGGPGSFFLEAGRNMGPFLNSANTDGYDSDGSPTPESYAGGIIAVGNQWNPYLAPVSANLYVMFGIAKGADYNALSDYYLNPANEASMPDYLFEQETGQSGNTVANRSAPIYAPILINWMRKNFAAALESAYGTTNVTWQQAYDAFVKLPQLEQQIFLLDNVYFNELAETSVPDSGSYEDYSRGYIAVNLLFPSSLGYTANNLGGGSNGANKLVETGDLDLRLSTIETEWGGNIYILGPGGRALIGSTVATSAQAALHTAVDGQLYAGIPIQSDQDFMYGANGDILPDDVPYPSTVSDIPAGYEGVLTLRGGSIDTFTDEDFLLNQSRLFTEDGGNIIMWSSNGSLNAGQGPLTSSDFPPIVVETDEDLYTYVDSSGAVTGAGIAAFQPAPGVAAPDVYLVAPRGTVDAGAAGVRVSGNLFVAAFQVANTSNFSVSGTTVGVPGTAVVNVAAQTSGTSAAAAASQMAQAVSAASNNTENEESVITVDVLGYAGGGDNSGDEETRKRKH